MEVLAIVFPFPAICFPEEKYTDEHRNNQEMYWNTFITTFTKDWKWLNKLEVI